MECGAASSYGDTPREYSAAAYIDTGQTELRYRALVTDQPYDVVEYPDSNKIGVAVGPQGRRDLRALFEAEQAVDYFAGEF